MRIVLLATTYFPLLNGHVRLIHNHAVGLSRRGHVVFLVTPLRDLRSSREEMVEGVRVSRIAIPRSRNVVTMFFRLLALVKGMISIRRNTGSADILYALGVIPCIAALLLRRVMKSKVVLALDDLTAMKDQTVFSNRVNRMIAVLLSKLSDATIFPTAFARNYILGNRETKKAAIIPPGTDLNFFASSNRFNIQKGLILYAGGIRKRKGLDTLIRSVALVKDRFPDCRLVLAGAGAGRSALEALVQSLGISSSVDFTGRISEQELKQLHTLANIYVVPTSFDAYATSLVEAMAMSEPVISTNVSAPAEIVENGKSGLLVDFGDVQQLANAIARILTDEEFANSLGKQARKRVEELYDAKKSAASLEDLFRSLLA